MTDIAAPRPATLIAHYEQGTAEMGLPDEPTAWKLAANELMKAVHEQIPHAAGEGGSLMQQAFHWLSLGHLPYRERVERVVPLWERYRALGPVRPSQGGPLRLVSVAVTGHTDNPS